MVPSIRPVRSSREDLMRHRTTALLAGAALISGLALTTATAPTAAAATTTPRPASTHTLAGGVRLADQDCDTDDPGCGDCDDGLLGRLLGGLVSLHGGIFIGIHIR